MKLSEAYFKPIGWVMNKARYPVLRVILASFICFFACLYLSVVGIIEFIVRTTPDFFADIWYSSKDLLKDAWQGDWS